MSSINIEKFGEFTQILTKDYRILFIDIKVAHPTPLQWTFFMNELNENLRSLDNFKTEFAFIIDLKLIGLISTEYIIEFVNTLKDACELLESKLIASSIIYEGMLINRMFEILKLFYKTKKPIEFVPDMRKAIEFIESNETS
jgi:hypothetical protein